jgi:energy-converting hydrogenase Eha subunit B
LAAGICLIKWIICDICVEVNVVVVPHWIGLQEPPQLRGVVAGAVVVQNPSVAR